MSDQPETYGEDVADMDYTQEQAADAELYLDDPDATDDVPWTPPEQEPMGMEFLDDDGQEETIDQRIAQEEPETGTAYGAPESGGQLDGPDNPDNVEMLGGDDPDAIPAEDDVLEGPA